MTNETRDEAPRPDLKSMLRAGDPAADGLEPGADETTRLRARVLDAVIHPHCAPDPADPAGPRVRWTPAAVGFAALFALLVLGAVTLRISRPAPSGTGRAAVEAGGTGETPAEEPRQIQFTTPGGTRVVWMLYPEDTDSDSRAGRGPGGRS